MVEWVFSSPGYVLRANGNTGGLGGPPSLSQESQPQGAYKEPHLARPPGGGGRGDEGEEPTPATETQE